MSLINDILDYCLWKNNKIRLNLTEFPLISLLEEIYEILKFTAKLKKINFSVINNSNINLLTDKKRLQ